MPACLRSFGTLAVLLICLSQPALARKPASSGGPFPTMDEALRKRG